MEQYWQNAASSELEHLPDQDTKHVFLFPGYQETKQPDGGGFESF